jgi:hypothetical protein
VFAGHTGLLHKCEITGLTCAYGGLVHGATSRGLADLIGPDLILGGNKHASAMGITLVVGAVTVAEATFGKPGITEGVTVDWHGFAEVDLLLDNAGILHGAPLVTVIGTNQHVRFQKC